MRWQFLIAATLFAAAVTATLPAHADPVTGVRSKDDAYVVKPAKTDVPTIPIVVLEDAVVFVPAAVYYWDTPNDQKVDWYYHWDERSWKEKLTSFNPIVLDTNKFEANAIRHPMVGALTYQVGRSNGWGVVPSLVMDFVTSAVWEYCVEFKEQPSLNDMASNTLGGILIGEPLFQIGKTTDDHPSAARRMIGLLSSPFHRAQREAGLSPLAVETAEPNRLEVYAAGEAVSATDAVDTDSQAKVGLDLEVFANRDYGTPGFGTEWTGFGTWNRVTGDLRIGGPVAGVSGGDFRSSTTYVGTFTRHVDEMGDGAQYFVGLGTTFDVVDRRLPIEYDKYADFQLVQPRVGAWFHGPAGDLDLELSGSADVAMVTSHARDMMPTVADSSIVLSQNYYYATGLSAQARARARRGRWNAEVESIYHQFWSFDEHTHGGDNDPVDLADQRIVNLASIGVRPLMDHTVRIELYGQQTLRKGTGDDLFHKSTELDTGLAVRAAF